MSLLQDLDRAVTDLSHLKAWMNDESTKTRMRDTLASQGADAAQARVVLAVLMLARDEHALGDSPHDAVMRSEARRFYAAFDAAFQGTQPAEPFTDSVTRACRFYGAWRALDIPQTLAGLMEAVSAEGLRQRNDADGDAAPPPEELFHNIALLGGPQAEVDARERFDWLRTRAASVRAPDLASTVTEIAERAFWDAISERVAAGDRDALFSAVDELHGAMHALIAHSPRLAEELQDRFDPAWLRQRVEHDALEPSELHALMDFVMTTIVEWQAPADAARAVEWSDATRARVRARVSPTLHETVMLDLLPFLRDAIRQLQQVVRRLVQLTREERT